MWEKMIIKSIDGKTIVKTSHRTIRKTVEWCVSEGIGLHSADLRKARLSQASLDGLKARGACFWGADFSGADMGFADLRRADLRCANLEKTCLAESDLEKADLQGAYFAGALLEGVNMEKAVVSCPSVWGCNMQDAASLEGLIYRHRGEMDIVLSRPPLIVRGLGKRLAVFDGACLWGADLYRAGEMPLAAQRALFSARTAIEKAMQCDISRPANKPIRKISAGAGAF